MYIALTNCRIQVPPMPVRAADPARLASGLGGVGGRAGEAVPHAGAGPGDGDCVQQLGGHRGEDKALGAAGRPQPELVDQHDEPLRIDVLLRLPGMPLLLLLLDQIHINISITLRCWLLATVLWYY